MPLREVRHSLLQWFQLGKAAAHLRIYSFLFGTREHRHTCVVEQTQILLPRQGSPERLRPGSCPRVLPNDAVKPTSTCLSLLGVQLFGRPLLLSLPQVTADGDGVHTGGHGFGWYLAELLPIRVVLVQALDHLDLDALGPDAGQPGDLLRLGAVGVHGPELASSVSEQHQEVIGFGFLHFLKKELMSSECCLNAETERCAANFNPYVKYFVLLSFIDFACQAAVSQGVLDDVLVGLCTWLLV